MDNWPNEEELKRFKALRYESKIKVLDWMPFRKELNALGFDDDLLKKAIIADNKKIYGLPTKKKPFDEVYQGIFTETIKIKNGQPLPAQPCEQISGIFTETVEIQTAQKCGVLHQWVYSRDNIEFRVSRNASLCVFDSFLETLLILKCPQLKKHFRHNFKGPGLGSWYGIEAANQKNINLVHNFEYRTRFGDINGLLFVDIATGNIENLSKSNLDKEIQDYTQWRKPQIEMNDKDLKEWLKERGFIYVYDGHGHEEKNLVKKYIPTVKQQRKEWQQEIENIKKRYSDPHWLDFLKVVETLKK